MSQKPGPARPENPIPDTRITRKFHYPNPNYPKNAKYPNYPKPQIKNPNYPKVRKKILKGQKIEKIAKQIIRFSDFLPTLSSILLELPFIVDLLLEIAFLVNNFTYFHYPKC